MFINEIHPRFDPAMELLASLPVEPGYATYEDLREDLGFQHASELQRLVNGLKTAGYHIRQMFGARHGAKTGVLCLHRWGAKKAQDASRRYLATVYGMA